MEEKFIQEQGHDRLSDHDRKVLLQLAREALKYGVQGKPLPPLDLEELSGQLTQTGATFVTLTIDSELRGCIGSLEARRPLAEDVQVHAVAAALEDYRFPPVSEHEVGIITIEISRLTSPQRIQSQNAEDLISQIRPGIDGVILMKGRQRATFLPQVWRKVPEVEQFLDMLCRKMGSPSDCWREKDVQVFTYQVEKFQELE
jgi:AmmeMemoRadiSam system protein A